MGLSKGIKDEGEPQDNFVEAREPTELTMCIILSSAYLGLARYCWTPLFMLKNWKFLVNVEGFCIIIAAIAILLGLRPYINPSSLQLSNKGVKYRGPYWPQRKTVNWDQVSQVYLSPELVVVLYFPRTNSRRMWPMLIESNYLAEREHIPAAFIKYCPIEPIVMTRPHILSVILTLIIGLAIIIWLAEMLIS